jgi:hypothetical protein
MGNQPTRFSHKPSIFCKINLVTPDLISTTVNYDSEFEGGIMYHISVQLWFHINLMGALDIRNLKTHE